MTLGVLVYVEFSFPVFQNVHLHVLDLSKPRLVYEFAKQFAETWKSLNVLVRKFIVNTIVVVVLKVPVTQGGCSCFCSFSCFASLSGVLVTILYCEKC